MTVKQCNLWFMVSALSAILSFSTLSLADKHVGTPIDTWQMGELPRTLIIALDGVPYGAMEALYQQGNFHSFHPPSKMVSTFPSMSDVAFTEIFELPPTDGYQQVYFSHKNNRLIGGLGSEMFELEEFEHHFDSILHTKRHLLMLYISSHRAAQKEMALLRKKLWSSNDKAEFYAYIAASDAIAHRFGPDGLRTYLLQLDKDLAKIQLEYRAKTGRDLNIVLLSDHGNTLIKGQLVDTNAELIKRGLDPSKNIQNNKSVVSTVAGVVGYWALYTQKESAGGIANSLLDMEGLDLIMYRHGDSSDVVIESPTGKAIIGFDETTNQGTYLAIHGDPLGYLPIFLDRTTPISQAEIFEKSKDSTYPNAIYRIHRCFNGEVKNTASVIVSLKPGYEFSSKIIKAAAIVGKRWGTHGSLHAADSLGIYMRTDTPTIDIAANKLGQLLPARQINTPSLAARNATTNHHVQ
ncbi:MAG: alkaline phosphatase family protein [Pseudomonadales bacterium]